MTELPIINDSEDTEKSEYKQIENELEEMRQRIEEHKKENGRINEQLKLSKQENLELQTSLNQKVNGLQQEIDEYYTNFRVSNNLLELRNLVQVSELIIRSALERKESRGLHYTLDYPEPKANPEPTVLFKN